MAEPDSSADTSMVVSIANSTSHGTVSSILAGYITRSPEVDHSLQSASQASIETEAGTAYSQKSKRQHGGEGNDTWDWSSIVSTVQGDNDGKNKTEKAAMKESE